MRTEEKVSVTLRSRQSRPGEPPETVEQTARGRLAPSGSGWVLRYREGDGAGLGDAETELTLAPGQVEMVRRGETGTRMVFRPGCLHRTDYRTPYGTMAMEVFTRRAHWSVDRGGGTIELHYDLTLDGQGVGATLLRIRVEPTEQREKENPHDS